MSDPKQVNPSGHRPPSAAWLHAGVRKTVSRLVESLSPGRMRRRGFAGAAAPEQGVLASFNRYGRAYFQRWLIIGALIGVVSGLGAIVFASSIAFCTHLLIGGIAGFTPPSPAGEGATRLTPIGHPWLLPVVTTLGGLLTGIIVFTLAPEAEGHGTDAAIEAFHEKGGYIRGRIPFIKLVASAITIGSGGSAGREGPTAQISAGFGSWLGGILHLDEHDRRIAMAAGIGSGIGSIFKAPFGGALLSAEILYKCDFEVDALFPSFVASAIGFTIYGAWAGWTPVFGPGHAYTFTQASSLLGYLILGVCAGLVGLLYPKTLYGVRDLFRKIHIPNYFKPAIGGLAVGMIGLVLPEALGMGYGYVQFGVNGDFTHLAAWLLFALVFVKILATSLTIGSGGSGGVFGPGMVIGGFLGGALWAGLHAVTPGLVAGTSAGAFVVVGMGAFFGGIAKAPLAVILMVAEMTGEYSLIAPAMLATMVAYLVTGETSIYESQVPTRLDSPAHKDDFALPLLQSLTVRDVMTEGVSGALATATPDTPLSSLAEVFENKVAASIPVIADGRLVGIVTAADLASVPVGDFHLARARQVMSHRVLRARPDESLYQAWFRMTRAGVQQLVVVDTADHDLLVGILPAHSISQLLQVSEMRHRASTKGRVSDMTAVPFHRNTASETANVPVTSAAVASALSGSAGTPSSQANLDPLQSTRVEEVMLATPRFVEERDPVSRARGLLDERGAALMVVDEHGNLVGIVSRSDLRGRQDREQGRELTVGDVAVRNLVTARPEETLRTTVRRMSRLGLRQLPVVRGELPVRPVGLLRRSDVLKAYRLPEDSWQLEISKAADGPSDLSSS